MGITKQLKKEIIYAGVILALVAQMGSMWTGYQKDNTITIYAKEKPSVEVISTPTPPPTIEEMILNTFGDEGETALAVAMAESTMRDEKCHIDEKEYSCGLFQINLRAHYDKVPGDNFEEKAEWLSAPKNNIKIAKKIFDKSYWYPWTMWLNGVYKNYL